MQILREFFGILSTVAMGALMVTISIALLKMWFDYDAISELKKWLVQRRELNNEKERFNQMWDKTGQ